MKIEILGMGCPKCQALEAATKAAADRQGIVYDLEHVTDITEIMQRGVMMTPALVIDGELKVSGKVPGEAAITTMLKSALALQGLSIYSPTRDIDRRSPNGSRQRTSFWLSSCHRVFTGV